MIKTILFFILFCSSPVVWASGYQGKYFRGYFEINKIVKQRVGLPTGQIPSLSYYLGGSYDLINLMGYYHQGNNDGVMSNGTPNTMNVLLYHLVFDQLAQGIGEDCEKIDMPSTTYQEPFHTQLKVLCNTPLDAELDENLLADFWLSIMGFDAPMEEFQQWAGFVTGQAYPSHKQRAHATLYALFMNPYFILQD